MPKPEFVWVNMEFSKDDLKEAKRQKVRLCPLRHGRFILKPYPTER